MSIIQVSQFGGDIHSPTGPPAVVATYTAPPPPHPSSVLVCFFPLSPWTTFVMASSEMACVYAALILHDESISITVRLLFRTMGVTLLIPVLLVADRHSSVW